MRSLARDDRGGVAFDYLVVLMPLFGTFLALVQLSYANVASLIVRHAAVTGARSAAVVLPDLPGYYGSGAVGCFEGDRKAAIEESVARVLRSFDRAPRFEVTLLDAGGNEKTCFQGRETVRVRVRWSYFCGVPLGRQIVTGRLRETTLQLEASAKMPVQDAQPTG